MARSVHELRKDEEVSPIIANHTSIDYLESDWTVSFRSGNGVFSSASLLQVSQDAVAFEINGTSLFLQRSEILDDFKVVLKNGSNYSGQALLTSVIQSGTTIICEASLTGSWKVTGKGSLGERTLPDAFFAQWNAHRRVVEPFKLAVADLHCFLAELRRWLDQEELALTAKSNGDGAHGEDDQHDQLEKFLLAVSPTLDGLFIRFEEACCAVEPAAQVAHRVYLRRMLHPLMMACPFMYRIFSKPLGYAGDYEMMNMIWRDGFEGESFFAKVLNRYIINQAPGVSVRARVDYMTQVLIQEAARASSTYGDARICSVGCGPAREVRNCLAHPASKHARFVLLDFNDETLKHTRSKIEELSNRSGRVTSVEYVKKSAHSLMKEVNPMANPDVEGYDLVYSSGLYDYLNDRMCVALNTHLYGLLRPGGVLVVTNFTPVNPIQNVMEFMFEWFLIHRDSRQMEDISPTQTEQEDCRVLIDPTGCNAFLEARKPSR